MGLRTLILLDRVKDGLAALRPSELRRWIHTPLGRGVVIAVTVVIVGIAAAKLFWPSERDGASSILAAGMKVQYVCEGCGSCGELCLKDGQQPPVGCPSCGKKQAVQGFKCHKCGTMLPARQAKFKCHKCGMQYDHRPGNLIGSESPGNPEPPAPVEVP